MTMKEQIQELVTTSALQTLTLKTMQEDLHEIRHHLVGNGQPGLIKDVDRLKQSHKLRSVLLYILGTTVVGGFCSWIIAHV